MSFFRDSVLQMDFQEDCTHKNTQIPLRIFGDYAMISLGDIQMYVNGEHEVKS